MQDKDENIYVECKHGFRLLQGEPCLHDGVTECHEAKCEEEGRSWMQAEGHLERATIPLWGTVPASRAPPAEPDDKVTEAQLAVRVVLDQLREKPSRLSWEQRTEAWRVACTKIGELTNLLARKHAVRGPEVARASLVLALGVDGQALQGALKGGAIGLRRDQLFSIAAKGRQGWVRAARHLEAALNRLRDLESSSDRLAAEKVLAEIAWAKAQLKAGWLEQWSSSDEGQNAPMRDKWARLRSRVEPMHMGKSAFFFSAEFRAMWRLIKQLESWKKERGVAWLELGMDIARVQLAASPTLQRRLEAATKAVIGQHRAGSDLSQATEEQRGTAALIASRVAVVQAAKEQDREEVWSLAGSSRVCAAGRQAPPQAWAQVDYESVKVVVEFVEGRPHEVIADTGAGPTLWQEGVLAVESLRGLDPGRARLLSSASDHLITSKGRAMVQFKLGGHLFRHGAQITKGVSTPNILGVDFWARHRAKFDFDNRVIDLWVDGVQVKVPFHCGENDEVAREVRSAEDRVIQPGQAYSLRGQLKGMLSSGDSWVLEPLEGETMEEQVAAVKVKPWHQVPGPWSRSYAELVAEIEAEEEVEAIRNSVMCVAPGVVPAAWCSKHKKPFLPVPGVHEGEEPLIVRRGQLVAMATKMPEQNICIVQEVVADLKAQYEMVDDMQKPVQDICADGTTAAHMSIELELKQGDWRRGLSAQQIVALTRRGFLQEEYVQWSLLMGEGVQIGEGYDDLPERVREDYKRLVFAFKEVLAENPKKPGVIPGIFHKIVSNLPKIEPWHERMRRFSPKEEEVKLREVSMLLENDVVEEANSPYNNNLVLVKKKDGSIRTCVDFRRLNEVTKFDGHPLMRIDEALDLMGKAKVMSTLDNAAAFHSILMHPEDREKTAFSTSQHGQLQFKRMPFGLKNATSTYNRALAHVLRGLLWQKCIIYVDDSIVWGDDHVDHLESLLKVFTRFAIHGVQIKLSKCKFACKQLEFVGHVVRSGEGVMVDPVKVQAMLELSRPLEGTSIKSFLGAASYYKRFIQDFAKIAEPLRWLEKQLRETTLKVGELWGEAQEQAFEGLKAALAAAPVLVFPDFSQPFIVITDASEGAKGGVLCQMRDGVEKPIAYISKAMNVHERNYGASDSEGCAATFVIRKCRPYLHGSHCILVSDASSVKALVGKGQLESKRQQRYAMDLQEHSITVVHRAGAVNHMADALSRCGYGYGPEGHSSVIGALQGFKKDRCKWQVIKDELFVPMQHGKHLEKICKDAAQLPEKGEQGEPVPVRVLYDKLEQSAVLEQLVTEMEDTDSRAVQVWGEAMQQYGATRVAPVLRPRPQAAPVEVKRPTEAARAKAVKLRQAKLLLCEEEHEVQALLEERNGARGLEYLVHWKGCEVSEATWEPEAHVAESAVELLEAFKKGIELARPESPEGGAVLPAEEVVQLDCEVKEEQPTLESVLVPGKEELGRAQRQDPFMGPMLRYLVDKEMPASRLEKIRLLETSHLYEVTEGGLLCRPRDRGQLGVQLQVMVPEQFRSAVIRGCHELMEGHAAALRTFQKVRSNFWWPGMFLDIQKYVKYCVQCQFNRQFRSKAPIERHITSAAPGEVWVVDLLHFPEAYGDKYVLVAVDAYSRWVEVSAIADKKAATVMDAVVREIFTNTAGVPKEIISDQGSEFKGVFAEALKLMQVQQKYTAAYRSEGHGMVERYNRSLIKRVKSMVSQQMPGWQRALRWAKLATNNSVHAALSMGSEGLTPAEVHLGRRLNLHCEAALDSPVVADGKKAPSEYVFELQHQQRMLKEWLAQATTEYHAKMKRLYNRKGRAKREWSPGDMVRLKREVHGKGRKITHAFEGPYVIIKKDNLNEYTIQKVGESKKMKSRVHADRLASHLDAGEQLAGRDLSQEERVQGRLAIQGAQGSEFEVECIKDDAGTISGKDKRYLIKWVGYDQETWEPLENLMSCAGLIETYELKRSGMVAAMECSFGKQQGVYLIGTDRGTIQMDLLQGESAEKVLDEICREAGIKKEDIVFTWASPPCETYSRANWSNTSRGNHYRELLPGRPPREVGEKGDKARLHDRLLVRVKELLGLLHKSAMENPAMGLAQAWHMLDWETKRRTVDLCAYGWPYKKSTDMWIQGFDFQPKGRTGSGRCEKKCEQGMVNPSTGKFAHFLALAMEPQRGPRGAAHASGKCGMPRELLAEVLWAAAKGSLEGKVVLDLCAGFQSMREVAEARGAKYVAVDVQGGRLVGEGPRRRAAWALRLPSKEIVVVNRHGGLAISDVEKGETPHDAAARAAMRELGLSSAWVKARVVGLPRVVERGGLTLFVYDLLLPLQEECELRARGGGALPARATVVLGEAEDLWRRVEPECGIHKGQHFGVKIIQAKAAMPPKIVYVQSR